MCDSDPGGVCNPSCYPDSRWRKPGNSSPTRYSIPGTRSMLPTACLQTITQERASQEGINEHPELESISPVLDV
jgi:hypothetical protein